MDREINITLKDYLDQQEERALTHHKELLVQLAKIEAKQDYTNGRLRQAEIAIAILQWGYGVGVAVVGWVIYKTV